MGGWVSRLFSSMMAFILRQCWCTGEPSRLDMARSRSPVATRRTGNRLLCRLKEVQAPTFTNPLAANVRKEYIR
jgi:hypothetical protein